MSGKTLIGMHWQHNLFCKLRRGQEKQQHHRPQQGSHPCVEPKKQQQWHITQEFQDKHWILKYRGQLRPFLCSCAAKMCWCNGFYQGPSAREVEAQCKFFQTRNSIGRLFVHNERQTYISNTTSCIYLWYLWLLCVLQLAGFASWTCYLQTVTTAWVLSSRMRRSTLTWMGNLLRSKWLTPNKWKEFKEEFWQYLAIMQWTASVIFEASWPP